MLVGRQKAAAATVVHCTCTAQIEYEQTYLLRYGGTRNGTDGIIMGGLSQNPSPGGPSLFFRVICIRLGQIIVTKYSYDYHL